MNSLRSLKFEIKAPIPSRRNPEGNMLRCAAAPALSFISTSEREAKLFPVPVFRRKSVSSMFFLVAKLLKHTLPISLDRNDT